ncbi:TonB-dependent receptor [Psychroflexus sp. S27]|uniref:TonB-dependent receptor n=1 Tax=Psychroflexus sp. S27 TaxID=1982757 RepID=UPI001EE09B64|nr:TonB-dependent receptor [Psychroflexus sp. S27]
MIHKINFRHKIYMLLSFMMLGVTMQAQSQTAEMKGQVVNEKGDPIPFVNIYSADEKVGTSSDIDGYYELKLSAGEHLLTISSQGFRSQKLNVTLKEQEILTKNMTLIEDVLGLDEIVVTATRNRVQRRKTPVVVSTVSPRLLTATQSISMAEGLNYSPGLRVETNCQNCGFTQVRLNGLDGGYTQILMNSRPVFSSLLGVYGLEQIPTTIIDRVEVVRSGGSALFGSNAIAGTVNVITKDPVLNTWEIGSNLSYIDGKSFDRVLNFNTSNVADDLKSGVTFFGSYRDRQAYDADGDGFTEMVKLKNNTLGSKAFLKPNDYSRLSLNLNVIHEFRRGGDRLELAPQFTDITEQLEHDTFIGGLDYEINSKDFTQQVTLYTSVSHTDRGSFYGGLGGGRTAQDSILAANAFGNTKDLAWNNGVQYTKHFENEDILTAGAEFNHSATEDEIKGYNRLIDQTVNSFGSYVQYEWKATDKLTALVGTRFDRIDVEGEYRVGNVERDVDITQNAISPRLTLSYDVNEAIKLRGGYARGFRAPQAFNEDLHVSSVGGEPQFVILSENLETEYSDAYTASFNFSKTKQKQQFDLLVEGFYTQLNDPFTMVSKGASLPNGSILEEVENGEGAAVYGANVEFKYSPSTKYSFQIGGTFQKSKYEEAQLLYEAQTGTTERDIYVDEFVRNPDIYGFFTASWMPSDLFNLDITGTYTGEMTVPRVINSNGFLSLNKVDSFMDVNLKMESHVHFNDSFMITFSGGVKNIFNSYQDDFDQGPERDADYIYGPAMPRTYFIGIKFGKLH